jgi:hypothetical protein
MNNEYRLMPWLPCLAGRQAAGRNDDLRSKAANFEIKNR